MTGRPRKAQGPDRPAYFDATDIDRVMSVVLALASEVASLRDRLDTHERLANSATPPTTAATESHLPDAPTIAARATWRAAYIRRLFRVFTEDVDSLRHQANDP